MLSRKLVLPFKGTTEPPAKVVAVDLQPMAPVEGVICIQVRQCGLCCPWMPALLLPHYLCMCTYLYSFTTKGFDQEQATVGP